MERIEDGRKRRDQVIDHKKTENVFIDKVSITIEPIEQKQRKGDESGIEEENNHIPGDPSNDLPSQSDPLLCFSQLVNGQVKHHIDDLDDKRHHERNEDLIALLFLVLLMGQPKYESQADAQYYGVDESVDN